MKEVCNKCKKTISDDEIAITKRLINRGTNKFYCISCLADAFEVSEEVIIDKIEFFKKIGCTLFCK